MVRDEAMKRRLFTLLWPDAGWPPLLLPLALGVVQVVITGFAGANQPDREPLDALGYVLLASGPVALTARHRYPVAVLWTVVGVTLTYFLIGYPYGPVFLSVVVALYTAVTMGHRLAAWLGGATLYGAHFSWLYLVDEDSPSLEQLLAVGAWFVVVLAASEVTRMRREWSMEAERTREEEAQRRASEGRLRIARELHDVLAHHISLINVQAGVALHLMDKKPEQAATALTAIEHASREALSELRSVLSILQQPDEAAPRSPSPGLAGLESLISQTRAAGVEVTAQVDGEPQSLPAPVDAAAYRIVQEALTNVVRHAAADRASVFLRYGDEMMEIQIDDNGRGSGQSKLQGGGSGIPGMRERVIALGGEFEAGPLPQGGFRVHAQLPLIRTQ